jgi:hypothetical protein
MVEAPAGSQQVRAPRHASLCSQAAVVLAVLSLYADAWAHNHLVRDVGWWGTFPSRPGPPHFPAGLSLWHLPYLTAVVWVGAQAFLEQRAVRGGSRAPRESRGRAAAAGVALLGWLLSTVSSGARTPGAAFVRLESLPGLVGPGALLQAGALVHLGWWLASATRGWSRVAGGFVVLSTLTFLTQFAHPYVDPWPSAGFLRTGLQTYRYGLFYFGEAMGLLSLLLQASVASGVLVAVGRAGLLPAGGWTVLFGANGLLLASLRDHHGFVAAALLTGLVADLLAARARGGRSRGVRLWAGAVAAAFCSSVFLVVGQMGAVDVLYGTGGGFALPQVSGLGWSVQLWMGASLAAGAAGWLVAWVADPSR